MSQSCSLILFRLDPVPSLTIREENSTPMVCEDRTRPGESNASMEAREGPTRGVRYIHSSRIDAARRTCTKGEAKRVSQPKCPSSVDGRHTFQRHWVPEGSPWRGNRTCSPVPGDGSTRGHRRGEKRCIPDLDQGPKKRKKCSKRPSDAPWRRRRGSRRKRKEKRREGKVRGVVRGRGDTLQEPLLDALTAEDQPNFRFFLHVHQGTTPTCTSDSRDHDCDALLINPRSTVGIHRAMPSSPRLVHLT